MNTGTDNNTNIIYECMMDIERNAPHMPTDRQLTVSAFINAAKWHRLRPREKGYVGRVFKIVMSDLGIPFYCANPNKSAPNLWVIGLKPD